MEEFRKVNEKRQMKEFQGQITFWMDRNINLSAIYLYSFSLSQPTQSPERRFVEAFWRQRIFCEQLSLKQSKKGLRARDLESGRLKDQYCHLLNV